MANFLEVLKSALIDAREAKCTRFPNGNGYREGHSAQEYVNKALAANGITDAKGNVLQLNKSMFNKIINTVELKEAGLTRFDGENGLRTKSEVDVLSMFGLTAAPKQHRKPRVDEPSTAATASESPASAQAEQPVVNADDDDFGDFN